MVDALLVIVRSVCTSLSWLAVETDIGTVGRFPEKSDCVNAIFISYAASLVVPRIGEVSRCGVLAKYDNVSFAKSLGTVVTERLVDTLTILLITGITVLLQLPIFVTFLQQTGTKIPSLIHLLTSVWFYIILFCFIGVVILLYYLRKTLFFYERVKGFVLNIWEGIMSLKGVRNIPLFIFIHWLFGLVTFSISILHSIALPLRHIWVSLRHWSCLSAARLP